MNKMQIPTSVQLHTAIDVLTKLGARLKNEAAYSINQLPETHLGAHYAGKIGAMAIEQTIRIEKVTAQLKSWCEEWDFHDRQFNDAKNAAEDEWNGVNIEFQKPCDAMQVA